MHYISKPLSDFLQKLYEHYVALLAEVRRLQLLLLNNGRCLACGQVTAIGEKQSMRICLDCNATVDLEEYL